VDGQLTLSENIPDNGGLKSSFRTFQRLLLMSIRSGQKRKQIRGMEHFTESQLFFLNFAFVCERAFRYFPLLFSHSSQSLCSVENGQYRRRMLATDIHSPNPARVNLVVGNSQAFADAFGCKQGDKMFIRQSERCELW
jgi:predicted metalloendopeptidase